MERNGILLGLSRGNFGYGGRGINFNSQSVRPSVANPGIVPPHTHTHSFWAEECLACLMFSVPWSSEMGGGGSPLLQTAILMEGWGEGHFPDIK